MRRWNCGRGVGICALALGVGILIAAIFPVGCLMFIVENAHHRLESTGIFAGHSALLILRKGIEETAPS